MEIAFHIGANCTDGERLLKSLLKNADTFASQGIRVPGPGTYRRLLRETIQNLNGAPPAPDTREILLEAIVDDAECSRLVLSHGAFLAVPNRIFHAGAFYPAAEAKLKGLASLFPGDSLEFHIGLRNPATYLPAVFEASKDGDFLTYMSGFDPMTLRWSHLIERIRAAVPQARLTVWCNEDTPLLWAQLIRELSGVDALTPISGGFDLISSIMSEDGMRRFLAYLKSHPPQTENQKRRIIAAFLDKYALEDEIEEEITIDGWTEDLLGRLTEFYEDDVDDISHMEGVNFITP